MFFKQNARLICGILVYYFYMSKIESEKLFAKKILLVFGLLGLGVGGMFLGMKLPDLWSQIQTTFLASKNQKEEAKFKKIEAKVVPQEGFSIPVSWGDVGPKLIELGVIDQEKFEQAVSLTDEQKNILTKGSTESIKINADNSQFVVDLLWALGLAQKSLVYDEGPLGTDYKAERGDFASTGGWTLAKGDPLKYLNKYDLIPLTAAQQGRVAEIAKNIYRPCCGNSTWFPDCNHGMAMLAAIELMVSKDMSDDDIYKNALKLNSFWFSNSYLSVAVYFDRQGIPWEKIDAKKVLGNEYSSASGNSDISNKVGPLPGQSFGGSCGA